MAVQEMRKSGFDEGKGRKIPKNFYVLKGSVNSLIQDHPEFRCGSKGELGDLLGSVFRLQKVQIELRLTSGGSQKVKQHKKFVLSLWDSPICLLLITLKPTFVVYHSINFHKLMIVATFAQGCYYQDSSCLTVVCDVTWKSKKRVAMVADQC